MGIDLHEPQLLEAATLCGERGLSNVSFRKADACETQLPDNMFDLVYLPVPANSCYRSGRALERHEARFKPGGMIFAEDGDLRSGERAVSALDH